MKKVIDEVAKRLNALAQTAPLELREEIWKVVGDLRAARNTCFTCGATIGEPLICQKCLDMAVCVECDAPVFRKEYLENGGVCEKCRAKDTV